MRRNGSNRELKERCHKIRDTLRFRALAGGVVTENEIAMYWPGGEENPGNDHWAWIFCYASMTRLSDRLRGLAKQKDKSTAIADAQVLDALRAEPIPVMLTAGSDDASPLYVYPKGLDALMHLHALDATCGYLTAQRAWILANPTAMAMASLPQVMSVLAYTEHLLCWIVTAPGPEMPYASDNDTPKIPPHIKALSPWDVMRICRAHQQHMGKLSALSSLIDETSEQDKGPRPSWSMFIGALALDMGESPTQLMRHRSLMELMAMVRLNAAAKAVPEKAA